MTEFWALASPYARFPHGIDAAHNIAAEALDLLIAHGIKCFSPIVFCHETAKELGLDPFDHGIWLPVCEPIMRRAKG